MAMQYTVFGEKRGKASRLETWSACFGVNGRRKGKGETGGEDGETEGGVVILGAG